MKYTIEQILEALNDHKIRATYEAVGGLLGCPAKNVAQRFLGNRRPLASWVVNKGNGMPSGYMTVNCHKDLQSNSHIVDSPVELIHLIGNIE